MTDSIALDPREMTGGEEPEEKREWDSDLVAAFVVLVVVVMLYIFMPDLSQAVWIP